MKIIQIGSLLDSDYVTHIDYDSDYYLLDADLIIIDMTSLIKEFSKVNLRFYQTEWAIDENLYDNYLNLISERTNQLTTYLNNKGNIFVSSTAETEITFKLFKNNAFEEVSIDFFSLVLLSSTDFSIIPAKGNNLVYETEFKNFFEPFTCSYEFYYRKYEGYSIAKIKNTKQVVSLCIPKFKGNIIILPKIGIQAEDHAEYLWKQDNARNALISFDLILKDLPIISTVQSVPDWCQEYYIGDEIKEIERYNTLKIEEQNIKDCIVNQIEILEGYNRLKLLFYGTGKPLESIIEFVFKEIGYGFVNTDHHRDDLILVKGNDILVVEIKGVKGSSAEKHAAQLMKWVNNYHIEHEVLPKGILIVNGFNETPLNLRTEKTFPHQMLRYCEKMEICLLTSIELLNIYLDYKAERLPFNEIHELLFSTSGELNYYNRQITNEI